MNMLFKNNCVRKRGKYDIKIHKFMIMTVKIYQKNKKLFVTVKPKKPRELEFEDPVWLTFHDQPQSDIVVFAITNFRIYI